MTASQTPSYSRLHTGNVRSPHLYRLNPESRIGLTLSLKAVTAQRSARDCPCPCSFELPVSNTADLFCGVFLSLSHSLDYISLSVHRAAGNSDDGGKMTCELETTCHFFGMCGLCCDVFCGFLLTDSIRILMGTVLYRTRCLGRGELQALFFVFALCLFSEHLVQARQGMSQPIMR